MMEKMWRGSMRRKETGFSLIEVMAALAVLGVLTSLAAPSFQSTILDNRLRTTANELLADIASARIEAAKRRGRVTLCKNATDASVNTACATTTNWTDGWLLFVDTDDSGTRASTETLLRVHQPVYTGIVITVSPATDFIKAKPVGTIAPASTFKFCDSRTGNFGRSIAVSAMGKVSLTANVACP